MASDLRKAVIKSADMSEDMQQDAVDCATQAMEKYNIEKDIAAYIKKEFDKVGGLMISWFLKKKNCIFFCWMEYVCYAILFTTLAHFIKF